MADSTIPLKPTPEQLEDLIQFEMKGVEYAQAVTQCGSDITRIIRCVATVMIELEYGLSRYSQSLQKAYAAGFKYPYITQGYHQLETMFSFRLGESVQVMHLTVRLYTERKRDYKTMHVYVTKDGRVAGATLWNTQLNQPVS